MKQLYIECNMGVAGDMLMGALFDICPDPQGFLEHMAALGLPGVQIFANRVSKSGVTGMAMDVHVHGSHEHAGDDPHHSHDHGAHKHSHEGGGSLTEVLAWVERANVTDKVKADVRQIFSIIAEAEATVHGVMPENVHFHELGTLDALADIMGCCLLMDMIRPDRVVCSPVHVGSGQVKCAHGILPVPAPATALILKGVPVYGGDIRGELCTPTGAALVRYFADTFGPMPAMTLESVGYGFGKKEFPVLNCVRVMSGTAGGSAAQIVELRCNIDDMTGEALGAALETLMDGGALDAFFTPIQMKKNRPAVMLTCLCLPEMQVTMSALIFAHTTTLGIRRTLCARDVLEWDIEERQTPYGKIRVKRSVYGETVRVKPESDDVKAAARAHGVSYDTVYQAALRE